jgi:hypothetical protein
MRRIGMLVGAGLLAALAVTGCKKESAPGQPKSIAEVAQQAAGMPKPLPGLYRSTAELVSLEAPGLPAGAAAQMKQMMASRAAPRDFCLTGAEADKGYEERVKKLAGRPDCHFDHYSAVAGKLDAQLTCTGGGDGAQGAVRSVLTMQGTMAPDGSDVTLAMAQSGAQLPGGGMKMTMHVKSARVGDCPAS